MTLQKEPRPARGSRIPGGEQIKRLLRQTGHINRMLTSYSCEPRTERQFNLRASLRERLRNFETHCTQGMDRFSLQQLLGEFTELEVDAWKYIQEATR